LKVSLNKPRWIAHLIFARKVKHWIDRCLDKKTIIHSHERLDCHHLTSIHSSLYNFPPKAKFPSIRDFMNERIEKRELYSSSVQAIVPVSSIIFTELKEKYPERIPQIVNPITPGVSPINISKKNYNPNRPVIGFMGKEWRRKGLPLVIKIWRDLRTTHPEIRLVLAGFPVDQKIGIQKNELELVDMLGHVDDKKNFYEKIDLLLHPASKEAYGMVIAEANSICLPVLCSKECGAAEDNPLREHLLSCNDPVSLWTNQANQILQNPTLMNPDSSIDRSWKTKAIDYVRIYESLKMS
jgi:UDP-glucose:(heptosyl)LPS alpha-1,3-glucosyltransferase